MPRVSGDVLATGQDLYLVTEFTPHEVRHVTVAQVRHGLIWVSGLEKPESGERVFMECRLRNDAIYRALGRVEFVPPQSWALRRIGEWERVQRREHVRVAPRGLDMELTHDEDDTGIASFPVLDLSCGGARLRTTGVAAEDLTPGTLVRCRFDLPDAGWFELRAQVIRAQPPESDEKPGSAALRFLDLSSDVESELTRWVLREQARMARAR